MPSFAAVQSSSLPCRVGDRYVIPSAGDGQGPMNKGRRGEFYFFAASFRWFAIEQGEIESVSLLLWLGVLQVEGDLVSG